MGDQYKTLHDEFSVIEKWVLTICSLWIIPLEMITRNHFGVRYLALRGVISLFLLAGMAGFIFKEMPTYIGFFLGAIGLRMLKHYWDIYIREKNEVMWHSRSPGVSWLIPAKIGVREVTVHMNLEPLVCFLFGAILITISSYYPEDQVRILSSSSRTMSPLGFVGGYIMYAAFFIFIRNQHFAWKERVKRWDIIDMKIESEYNRKIVRSDVSQKETNGFIKMGAKPRSMRMRQEMADMQNQQGFTNQSKRFNNSSTKFTSNGT